MSFEIGSPIQPAVPQEMPGRPNLLKRALALGMTVLALTGYAKQEAVEYDNVSFAPEPAVAAPAPDTGRTNEELPLVQDDGYYKNPKKTIINSRKVAADIDQAVEQKRLPGYRQTSSDESTSEGKAEDQFSTLFHITLGKDNQLHYKDETKGVLNDQDKTNILGTVAANEVLIVSTMQTGHLKTLDIHMYAPNKSEYAPATANGFYDPSVESPDSRKSTDNPTAIDIFLDSSKDVDQETLLAYVSHESLHAGLQQGLEEGEYTPEEAKIMAEACNVIRDDAADKLKHYSKNITDQLRYFRKHSPKAYAPAYTKVMKAIQNGTFDDLPVANTEGRIADCNLQSVIGAVFSVATEMNLQTKTLERALYPKDARYNDQHIKLSTDWGMLAEYNTVYSAVSEHNYLPENGDKFRLGHPESNSDETIVSFVNLAIQFPEQAALGLSTLTSKQREAYLAITKVGVSRLKKLYPENLTLSIQLDLSMHQLNKALEGIKNPNAVTAQPSLESLKPFESRLNIIPLSGEVTSTPVDS